jgi:NADPH-dependent ferric siderophore reductase
MSQSAATSPAQDETVDPRAPRRQRHEPKRRRLDVVAVDRLTPNMVRVTLSGPELTGFTSLGFDDHIKLFFPEVAPTERDAHGAPKPVSRDYTPRRYDPAANTLEIDFALHDAGPATQWAAQARPGQVLNIGGPRGSFIIPTAYDWHLLVGDDTALPAIGRRLKELPRGATAVVVAEIDDEADELDFDTAANLSVTWTYRRGAGAGSTDLLSRSLRDLRLPAGDYYAWVACESTTAKALRAQLLAEHGANPKWLRAAGYWRRGASAVHDTFDS